MPNVVETLKGLRASSSFDSLRSAIHDLSKDSGPVKSCMVSFDSGKRTVFCFLEMKSPLCDAEVRELGAVGFGSGVIIEFPVVPHFSGVTGTWSA